MFFTFIPHQGRDSGSDGVKSPIKGELVEVRRISSPLRGED
jgi:hypothetical protein